VNVQLTPAELPKFAADVQAEMRTHLIPDIIRAIPVAYEDSKPYIEKCKGILENGGKHTCSVCSTRVDSDKSLVLVCPMEHCQAVTHLACLSKKFLDEESNNALIPIRGTCQSCYSTIEWATMMKELSLRTHGEEDIKALLRTRRRRKADGTVDGETAEAPELDGEQDEDLDETWMDNLNDDGDRT